MNIGPRRREFVRTQFPPSVMSVSPTYWLTNSTAKNVKSLQIGDKLTSPDKVPEKTDKPQTKHDTIWTRVFNLWADDESVLRLLMPAVYLMILSMIFAAIFYLIESYGCQEWTFWEALSFVSTIFTTIGYGVLRPCTDAGKALTVLFSLISIILNVVTLANLGKIFSRLFASIWSRIKRIYVKAKRKKKHRNKVSKVVVINEAQADSDDQDQEEERLPLTLAVFITILWIILSAVFFLLTEQHLNYLEALYFVMISVTSIGLGDISPKEYNLVIVQFFFIIIGMSLFSMVIKIIQDKVDTLSDKVEQMIREDFAKAQVEGVALSSDDSEAAAREHVRAIIRKQHGGNVLSLIMGRQAETKLIKDYMAKSRCRLVGTQTDNQIDDKAIMAVPQTADFGVKVSPHKMGIMRDQVSQSKVSSVSVSVGLDYLNLDQAKRRWKP